MAELRELVSSFGWANPRTYIQSGNLVFGANGSANELGSRLSAGVAQRFGFEVDLLILSADQLEDIVARCPFGDGDKDPARVNIYFHLSAPANTSDIESDPNSPDRFFRDKEAHFIWTPDGLSKSALAERLTRRIAPVTTGRNLRTCRKILELSKHDSP